MRNVTLLGATGSIGDSTLDVIARHPDRFAVPDLQRFPCLALAYAALERGGSAPIVLNAANEVAVEAFLGNRARFCDIADVCARTLDRIAATPADSLDGALAIDAQARRSACAMLGQSVTLT